jgi:hypothetical protein
VTGTVKSWWRSFWADAGDVEEPDPQPPTIRPTSIRSTRSPRRARPPDPPRHRDHRVAVQGRTMSPARLFDNDTNGFESVTSEPNDLRPFANNQPERRRRTKTTTARRRPVW